jgi:hypothetical protein
MAVMAVMVLQAPVAMAVMEAMALQAALGLMARTAPMA